MVNKFFSLCGDNCISYLKEMGMKRKVKYKNKYKCLDGDIMRPLLKMKFISTKVKLYNGIEDCFFMPIQYIDIEQFRELYHEQK